MFGDMPSDYCEHEPFRMSIHEGYVRCQCGVTWDVNSFLSKYLIKQEERIKKLEAALANFLQ